MAKLTEAQATAIQHMMDGGQLHYTANTIDMTRNGWWALSNGIISNSTAVALEKRGYIAAYSERGAVTGYVLTDNAYTAMKSYQQKRDKQFANLERVLAEFDAAQTGEPEAGAAEGVPPPATTGDEDAGVDEDEAIAIAIHEAFERLRAANTVTLRFVGADAHEATVAELAALRARCAALEAALQPFANTYAEYLAATDGDDDDPPWFWDWLNAEGEPELIVDSYAAAYNALQT